MMLCIITDKRQHLTVQNVGKCQSHKKSEVGHSFHASIFIQKLSEIIKLAT